MKLKNVLQFANWLKFSDKQNDYVLNVQNTFEMKTIKYYQDLYLKHNFLLLADVFEKFRKIA